MRFWRTESPNTHFEFFILSCFHLRSLWFFFFKKTSNLCSISLFKCKTYRAIVHDYCVQDCKLSLVSPSGCIQHLNCFTKRICSRRSRSHNRVMFPYNKRSFVPALESQAGMRTADCPVSSADSLAQSVLMLTWVRELSLSNTGGKKKVSVIFLGVPHKCKFSTTSYATAASVCNRGVQLTARKVVLYNVIYVIFICKLHICRSQWPRGLRRRSAAARLLRLWVRISPDAWMSVVSVVCGQVEVSATSWSLVQRSNTDGGASLFMVRNLVNEALDHWGLLHQKKKSYTWHYKNLTITEAPRC